MARSPQVPGENRPHSFTNNPGTPGVCVDISRREASSIAPKTGGNDEANTMKNQLTKIVLLTGVLGAGLLVGTSKPANADSFYIGGRGFSLGFSNGPTYAPRYYAPRYYAPRYVAPYAYPVPYAAPYAYAPAYAYTPAYGTYDWRWHDDHGFRGPVFGNRDFHGGDFRGAPERHEFGGGR